MPRQLANVTHAHPQPPKLSPQGHAAPRNYGGLVALSHRYTPVAGRLHTRYAPVRRSPPGYCYPALPLDLHVLGLPLAFILSQDQTLHCKNCYCYLNSSRAPLPPVPCGRGVTHAVSCFQKFQCPFASFQHPPCGPKRLQRYNLFRNPQIFFSQRPAFLYNPLCGTAVYGTQFFFRRRRP